MLHKPRRLPSRYNRRTTLSTRRFVQRRHQRRRRYMWERWVRLFQRGQRKMATMRRLLWQWLAVLVVGVMLLVIGLLLFSPLLELREIQVPRTDARIDQEQVIRAMAPLFRQHLFLLSSQEITPLLKKAIPDLQELVVQKRYPSTMVLRLTLDPVIARLSIEDPSGAQSASSSGAIAAPQMADYLTAQGMHVTYFPSQISASALPLIRVLDWGARPVPYVQMFDAAFLLEMREAEEALRQQFGQDVTEREVFLRAQEFHLQTKTFSVWFDRRSTLAEHLHRYRLFLKAVGPQGAKEYVDLRLADKVVYK